MNIRRVTFRLYPTANQETALCETLQMHQHLYNAALEERIDCYRKTGETLSFVDQCKSLTVLRNEMPEWAVFNARSQQQTLRRLDKAFSAFFRRVKAGQAPGFPRFKSLSRFPGFSYSTHGKGWRFTPGKDWRHGTLLLSGAGHIKARGKARHGGEIRSSDVLHRNGKWYLSLTLNVGEPQRERTGDAALAYDWGVETFLTGLDHAGNEVCLENPRWWQSEKDNINNLQRAVARKRNMRSNRRRKAVKRLTNAKGKTARRRRDWAHQRAAELAGQYALVATEKLRVSNMTRSAVGTVDEPGNNVQQKAGLNREILDTAPRLFMSLLRYKVLETGGEWVEAPTRELKPSQRCPMCWAVTKKQLELRTHHCASCGHTEPRDRASARVVLRWALEHRQAGQELSRDGRQRL